MSIFMIVEVNSTPRDVLGKKIIETYPDEHYSLEGGNWLVSDSTTAKAISDKLGLTEGEAGSAVIVEAASYYGRANPAIWSWIKDKWEG